MSTSNVNRPLHLLSLDGGGVRGLSSIIILKHLMENISKQRGRVIQPWEEFDMIGGTSTGGLIAVMLGRLRMTLGECEAAYLSLSDRIFNPKRSKFDLRWSKDLLLANGKFDYKVLEGSVKDIIAQKLGSDGQSALLKDPDPRCKVFVCATRTADTQVAILRSYDTTDPKLLFEECKIWEACRATSAATTFFEPIKMGKYGQEFADGAVLYNNPVQLVEREASTIWPDRMENAIMVSIGTGSAPVGAFKGNLMKIVNAMKKIVTQTEKTNEDFFLANQAMFHENRLYRFNVYHGLAEVGLDEAKEKEKIANATQTYLEKAEIRGRAKLCVDHFCKPVSRGVGPRSAEDVREQRRPVLIRSGSQREDSNRDLSDCLRSLSFAGIDSRRNAISIAHRGTCGWLFETPPFKEWYHRTSLKSNNGILWIKGHPGVGKSTLMKHTLLYCQEKFEHHNIAFYFFNARGGTLERSPLGLLRTLMVQLLEQNPALVGQFIPTFLKKARRHGGLQWEWETGELKEFLLHQYETRQCKPTLLLIDALDECDDPDVQEVVDFLENLSENAMLSESNLRICLSSRHYPHIDMNKKIELVVEKQAEHDGDIFKYIRGKLKASDTKIQAMILEMANHIFIWVVLVVEMLNKEFNRGKMKAMWKKLNEIPTDIDELFSKILEKENPEDDNETTILLFQWVLFSSERLEPTELYFAVLAGTNPEDLGAWDQCRVEFETIHRFINNASRGLVEFGSVKNYGVQDIVQFIHQSVIDFLTRNQRLVKLDQTLGPNPVGVSHARLVSCCLNYIMQKEVRLLAANIATRANSDQGDSSKTNLIASYPFLKYSAGKILEHAEAAQAEGISQLPLLRQFQKQGEFQILQSVHDNFAEIWGCLRGGQLLYAVSLKSCHNLARVLIIELEQDVNAQGGYYGTALQAAACDGSRDIVELLLEHGADVNAQGGYFGTALQAAACDGSRDIVELLLEHGADVNAQGGEYGNSLQAAIARGKSEIAVLLLERGADVNTREGVYGTALQAAIARGKSEIAVLLLERGADVNARGGEYGTALQAAIARGEGEIAVLLLERGADVNARGGVYGTALQAAESRDYPELFTLLRKHGAK